jgi:RNA polymerase sigma-B factor
MDDDTPTEGMASSPGRRIDHLLVELAGLGEHDPERAALRRRVVESQLPQRFRGRGEPYVDLVQVGTIGLLNAVDRFDPERGNFTAFAVPTILGEIRRHFRDRGWALRVPRRLQELGRRIGVAREELTHTLGRSPTVPELAAHLNEDADLVLEALDSAGVYTTVPLPTAPEEADLGHLGVLDEGLELVEDRVTLRPLLARLPVRERNILALRFIRGMSQSQIAAEVGVSQMHVSRLLTRSLAALRDGLSEEV